MPHHSWECELGVWERFASLPSCTFLFQSREQHYHGSTKLPWTCPRSLASLVFSFFAAFNGRRMNISCNVAVLCNVQGMFSGPETSASAPEHHLIWQWLVFRVLFIPTQHHNRFLVYLSPLFHVQEFLKSITHRFIHFLLHYKEFISAQLPLTVFFCLWMSPKWEREKRNALYATLKHTLLKMGHLWCRYYHTTTKMETTNLCYCLIRMQIASFLQVTANRGLNMLFLNVFFVRAHFKALP